MREQVKRGKVERRREVEHVRWRDERDKGRRKRRDGQGRRRKKGGREGGRDLV